MAASKKKKNLWILIGGAVGVVLLIMMMSRGKSSSISEPVYTPVLGSNPAYNGSYGGSVVTKDYSAQFAAVGKSLTDLSTKLGEAISKQTTPAPPQTPLPSPAPASNWAGLGNNGVGDQKAGAKVMEQAKTDANLRNAEIERTKAVIANRQASGLSTANQEAWLKGLQGGGK